MKKHLIIGLLISILATIAAGQNADDGFNPAPVGDISVVEPYMGNSLIVGGNYLQIGGLTRNSIALLRPDGTGIASFNAGVRKLFNGNFFAGTVRAVVVQDDGKIIIGGDFTEVNGTARNNIARLDSAGNLDTSFTADIGGGGITKMLKLPDGSIIIGGNFTTVNGVSRNLLAKISANGVLDTTANISANGTVIYALEREPVSGKIYVGGIASQFGGLAMNNAARLNADGKSVDPTFSVSFPGVGAFAFQTDGKIVVGHSTGIARISAGGTVDPTLNFGTGSWVNILAVQTDGKILMGGFFTNINGTPRNRLARLNRNGTLDTTFNPNVTSATGIMNDIFVQSDKKIIVGGRFEMVGGVTRNGIARIYADGSLDAATTADLSGGIALTFLPQADGKTLIGGNFTTLGGQSASRVGRLNANGSVDTTFPQFMTNGEVSDIAMQNNGSFIVVGSFDVAGGFTRNRIARFNQNPNVTLDFGFAPNVNNTIFSTAVQTDGKILIGGLFTTVNGTARSFLARLNADGTLDTSFAPSVNQGVYKIRIQADGKILIGGFFGNVGGQTRTGIARLNTDGSLDTSFNVTLGGLAEVQEIVLRRDDKIYIGGSFSSVNGSTTNTHIARIWSNGATDTSFGGRADSTVNAIAVQASGSIIVGGRFLNLNTTAKSYLGQFYENGAVNADFTMNANDTITAVSLQTDGKILVGGNFTTIGGQTRSKFARIANQFFATETFTRLTAHQFLWETGGTAPEIQRVTIEKSSDGVNYTFVANATRTNSWYFNGLDLAGNFIRLRGFYPDHSSYESFYESVIYLARKTAAPFDFDGDGKTDLSIFRPAGGEWWYYRSFDGQNRAFQFGVSTDRLTPADFTGDGKTDIAFWRPSTGSWYVLRSEDFSYYEAPFGASGDVPAPADYDGDLKTDIAIFRPSNATWYINLSSGGIRIEQFGVSLDVPTPADYDGDGKADLSVFRPTTSADWWLKRSSDQITVGRNFGVGTDKPVAGDYTGDGSADLALWRPSTGEWFVVRSENPVSFYAVPFGISTDIPVPGDYDGDGRFDTSIFRPSSATWYSQRTSGTTLIQQFGLSSDKPVPSVFIP